ncbi:hypothetical protein FJ364_00125 [Candidatus Dependentiae bacterium]|nr:hypothetical protein [Candidatus Dependentiae bacterium]
MDFQGIQLRASEFESIELESIELPVLMVQTGYLTIQAYDEELSRYTLTYPNFEVGQSVKYLSLINQQNYF